jgi:hypothetical protein
LPSPYRWRINNLVTRAVESERGDLVQARS